MAAAEDITVSVKGVLVIDGKVLLLRNPARRTQASGSPAQPGRDTPRRSAAGNP
jgi:hypothetical protein